MKMRINVQGVTVSLTEQQEKEIQRVLKQRERCRYSFKRMLKHFGFKELKDQPNSFIHKVHNWYAEVLDRGTWSDVWMTGAGLKDNGGIPGGHFYSTAREIEEEMLSMIFKSIPISISSSRVTKFIRLTAPHLVHLCFKMKSLEKRINFPRE